jgi:uncharacterized membrane protein (DUF4010 family)
LPADLTLAVAVEALAGALLVGFLIGAQREAAGGDRHPGLRDFLLVALAGGICGVVDMAWLDAAALLSIVALFAVYHYECRDHRTGITTELAAAAVFLLALLAASWKLPFAMPLAIGTAIIIAVFLEARERLHKLLRETITEAEFNATLRFVTLVLVIYPLLPVGAYGPYSFFIPRQVWLFVILISSISYVGYFLEKFLGEEKGLIYTSILGGLASTTAATMHFARNQKEAQKEGSDETIGLWRAFVIANSVQFPRALLIVALVNTDLAALLALPMVVMTLGGIVLAEVLRRWPHKHTTAPAMAPGNPFRLMPALQFGALFTVIVFLSKAASDRLGTGAFLGTSLLGGLVDVATVIAPAADLIRAHQLSLVSAGIAVLFALASNAALKVVLAAVSGTLRFAMLVLASFVYWAIAGAAAWWIAVHFVLGRWIVAN